MMQSDFWNGQGTLRARPAIDDVRTRVLLAGIKYVESTGLTLSISDAVIARLLADANVTPKQFGQVWQSGEEFLTDLFCELANQAQIDRADTMTLLTTWQYVTSRVDDLRTPEGRRDVLVDIIRTATEYNFSVVTASSKWRTYAALSTTIVAWPEGAARTRILDALRASELSFVETLENFYRNLLPTIGLRLKPGLNDDYQPFVVAAASVIEGLGIVRATVPTLVEARFEMPTFDRTDTWSVAAMSYMGVFDAFFEADPDFDPDEAIARLKSGIDVTP
ncbi:hypothetical protein ACFWHR_07240 [Leucobacter sp. NPDC058333]|uniref:hypothetical protein n=1 Tax=Leucobacter sp. NPDC058333 TaxID=3346450 RepID=UPI003646390E